MYERHPAHNPSEVEIIERSLRFRAPRARALRAGFLDTNRHMSAGASHLDDRQQGQRETTNVGSINDRPRHDRHKPHEG
jgi:hypothetical protein